MHHILNLLSCFPRIVSSYLGPSLSHSNHPCSRIELFEPAPADTSQEKTGSRSRNFCKDLRANGVRVAGDLIYAAFWMKFDKITVATANHARADQLASIQPDLNLLLPLGHRCLPGVFEPAS